MNHLVSVVCSPYTFISNIERECSTTVHLHNQYFYLASGSSWALHEWVLYCFSSWILVVAVALWLRRSASGLCTGAMPVLVKNTRWSLEPSPTVSLIIISWFWDVEPQVLLFCMSSYTLFIGVQSRAQARRHMCFCSWLGVFLQLQLHLSLSMRLHLLWWTLELMVHSLCRHLSCYGHSMNFALLVLNDCDILAT